MGVRKDVNGRLYAKYNLYMCCYHGGGGNFEPLGLSFNAFVNGTIIFYYSQWSVIKVVSTNAVFNIIIVHLCC